MSKTLRLLLVEDSAADAELILLALEREGYEVQHATIQTEEELRAALAKSSWDLIISDYSLPRFSGKRCLEIYHELNLDIPFILISGSVGEELAVACMKAGAHDYIMKDRLSRLPQAVQRELKETALRRKHNQLMEHFKYLTFHDPVTGLANERQFREVMGTLLHSVSDKGSEGMYAIFRIEINNAKELQSVLMPDNYDMLTRHFVSRILNGFEHAVNCARVGDSSFCVALLLTKREDAEISAQALTEKFQNPFDMKVSMLHADVSVGIALFPEHSRTVAELLRQANTAATRARTLGRSSVLYSAEHDKSNPENLALLGQLRQAIRDEQLILHYQPIMELNTEKIVGVEALVRWMHPVHGMIPPGRFIEPAERSDLIRPLTRWVIEEAFRQFTAWREQGLEIFISINLSVRNIQNKTLPEFISKISREFRINPNMIVFEITESAIMNDVHTANKVLSSIREMGFKISMDDFGTGHSSLAYLKNLILDHVKLDRSFISDITNDEADHAIVEAVMKITKQLNHTIIAEGVETREVLALLKEMQCHYAQGYYISKPLPATELTPWLLERNRNHSNEIA